MSVNIKNISKFYNKKKVLDEINFDLKEGEIVVGNTMKLTLACDHRVVDGLTGAKFLQSLKPLIENPLSMLI